MKHTVCGKVISPDVRARFSQTFSVVFNGRINPLDGSVDKTSNAELVPTEQNITDEQLNQCEFYCQGCGKFVPVSDISFDQLCICGSDHIYEVKCEKYNRYFCKNCYKMLVAQSCNNCVVKNRCEIYLGQDD